MAKPKGKDDAGSNISPIKREADGRYSSSGNPKGRPPDDLKPPKPLGDILQEVLSEKISLTINGRKRRVTNLEVLMLIQEQALLAGDPRSVRSLVRFAKETGALKSTIKSYFGVIYDIDPDTEEALRRFHANKTQSPPEKPANDTVKNEEANEQ